MNYLLDVKIVKKRYKIMYKEILLFSGGIDSFIGYYYLNKPQTVYFDLNSKYSKKEIKTVKSILHDIIIDKSLRFLGEYEQNLNAHIPFRNLYLALQSALRYSDKIYICGLKDDNMTDKNEKMFKKWSELFSEIENREIQVLSPFWKMTKIDIVKWFAKNFDKKLLLNTVSCYSEENKKYCGKCQSCFRKAVALNAVGINLPFYDKKIINYYKNRMNKGIYDKKREEYTLKYLKSIQDL